MKKILLPLGTLTVAGAVALGLLGTAGANAAGGTQDDPAFLKREDKANTLVLTDDDDDDDTNDDTRTRTRTGGGTGTQGTGSSRSRADGTNSRYSKVSRDADRSRGDLTRDWTRDGGDRTRDLTPNLTNDGTRNDTRG